MRVIGSPSFLIGHEGVACHRFQILVHNLNGRVQWQRSSISDLDLYIGYEYEVLAPDTQSLNVKTNEEY